MNGLWMSRWQNKIKEEWMDYDYMNEWSKEGWMDE